MNAQSIKSMETPPRAWGRRGRSSFKRCAMRNTPTCVGKTSGASITASKAKKHPHVRGEDKCRILPKHLAAETPPRAWGRQLLPVFLLGLFRNTPTCVGKTVHAISGSISLWKHPHVRGEDYSQLKEQIKSRETPPRAWGRPVWCDVPLDVDGNTPTCVGKTLFLTQS